MFTFLPPPSPREKGKEVVGFNLFSRLLSEPFLFFSLKAWVRGSEEKRKVRYALSDL